MKIALPRREVIFLVASFLFLVLGLGGAVKNWNASRSGRDTVTMVGIALCLFLLFKQRDVWSLLRGHLFEVPGATFRQVVEMGSGDVLSVHPLPGIERHTLVVDFSAGCEEQPGAPYKSFQMAPSPIRHTINSMCQVVLFDVSRGREEIARKTIVINASDDDDEKPVDGNELFVTPLRDGGDYVLMFQPDLPPLVAREGRSPLKWRCQVKVRVLVKGFGVYDQVQLHHTSCVVSARLQP